MGLSPAQEPQQGHTIPCGLLRYMAEQRFLEYDYDTREIIEYQRTGECNHCGDCCTTPIFFHGIGHQGRGVWGCIVEADKPDFFQQVSDVGAAGSEHCPYYAGKRCTIHEIKLRMCQVWPMTPAQARLFPDCSYAFVEIKRSPLP